MTKTNALALDVGEKRIGVARANLIARLPQALPTLAHDDTVSEAIRAIIEAESIDILVVGLPRNLSGQETAQSAYVRSFVDNTLRNIGVSVVYQDETLSSHVAEDRLKGKAYAKGDIDAGAAVVILQDYLDTL